MQFDFDTEYDFSGHHTEKYDQMASFSGVPASEGIAMWVADMDFRAMPEVLEALQDEVTRGFGGYFGEIGPVAEAVAGWYDRRHGWQIDTDHIRFTTGVIQGLTHCIEAYSEPGDGIVVFTPVYHAFQMRITAMGRRLHDSPLVLREGRYEMDLDALEASLTGRERIVTLCSPHNPGGRIWTAAELRALAELCARHDMILISDEIHMDIAFPGAETVCAAPALRDHAERLVVLTAASKAFNTAGGKCGFAIIEDEALRDRFVAAKAAHGTTQNRYGMIMTKAAMLHGDAWNDAVCAYLAENFRLWREAISALPGISVMDMEATYLTWVSFEGTGMAAEETTRRIHDIARIAMSPGPTFAERCTDWHRFNIAMPRPRLMRAIDGMQRAFADLQ